MEYLSLISATALGYLTFRVTTHPNSRIRKRLPSIRVKRVQVFPIIRVFMFGRWVHFHHWFNFSILLALSTISPFGVLEPMFTKGILLGGIIQGLTLKGHRKIVYKDYARG